MNALVPTTYQVTTVEDLQRLGSLMAQSGFFNDSSDVAKAVVKIAAGHELGIGPVTSMTSIYVVAGKITHSAQLIAAMIRKSAVYDYRIKHHDNQKCEIEFTMNGEVQGCSTFSIEDAQKAGLAGGSNWKKYPRNMLFARAISNGARWYCPDIFVGPVYTPDELGANVDGETGEVIEIPASQITVLPARVRPDQLEELEQLISRSATDRTKLLQHYKVADISELTTQQYADAVDILEKRIDVSITPDGDNDTEEESEIETEVNDNAK